MQPIQPYPKVAGDSPERIMSRSGALTGLTRTRAVWRFGFLPGSPAALAYGCAYTGKGFLFVLCDKRGKVLETFDGWGAELPDHFQRITTEPYEYIAPDEPPDRIDELTAEYAAEAEEIVSSAWPELESAEINEDYDDNRIQSVFLGTVFALMPSGKYYTPWANGNVTEEEAETDELFTDALEAAAEKRGAWIESGEGDPCDLFLCRHAQEESEAA